jgi:hypothetical protein
MAEAAKLLQAAQLYMGQALQGKLLSDKVRLSLSVSPCLSSPSLPHS